jgi:hypothetical protein
MFVVSHAGSAKLKHVLQYMSLPAQGLPCMLAPAMLDEPNWAHLGAAEHCGEAGAEVRHSCIHWMAATAAVCRIGRPQ